MNDLNLSTLAPIYPEVLQPLTWGVPGWIFGVILLLAVVGIWLWYRRHRTSKTPDAIMQLRELDFETQATESLYRFSLLMQSLPHEQQPHRLSELLDAIVPYKYAPNPPPLPDALKTRLIEAIREVTT